MKKNFILTVMVLPIMSLIPLTTILIAKNNKTWLDGWIYFDSNLDYSKPGQNGLSNDIYTDAIEKSSNDNTSVYIYRNVYSSVLSVYSSIMQDQFGGTSILVPLSPQNSVDSLLNYDILDSNENISYLKYNEYFDVDPNYFEEFDGDLFLDWYRNTNNSVGNIDLYIEDLNGLRTNFLRYSLTEDLFEAIDSFTLLGEGVGIVDHNTTHRFMNGQIYRTKTSYDHAMKISNLYENHNSFSRNELSNQHLMLFLTGEQTTHWNASQTNYINNNNTTNFIGQNSPNFKKLNDELSETSVDILEDLFYIESINQDQFIGEHNVLQVGNHVNDESIPIFIEQIEHHFEIHGENIQVLFKGHPNQAESTWWFEKLSDEVYDHFGGNDWFIILPHEIPMEVYFSLGIFTSDDQTATTFSIDMAGDSTSFAAALDAGMYDSIHRITGSEDSFVSGRINMLYGKQNIDKWISDGKVWF